MYSILVIDDSLFQRQIIKLALEGHPFEVHEASSAEEGFQMLGDLSPDIVTLDLVLPDYYGTDFLKRIAHLNHETRVIVITADIQAGVEEECLALGAEMVITKPIDTTKLAPLLEQLLGQG